MKKTIPAIVGLALALVIANLLSGGWLSAQATGFVAQVGKDPDTARLPYFVFRTLLRMFIAYVLVAIFGLAYGIIAGLYATPRKIMLPLLDIMQSIPVLGYLPAAVLFFVNAFPGQTGKEAASILLIFTGMAWAVAFGVYGAVRAIPQDLQEASKAFGVGGWKYIRGVVLPAVFPNFVTGSMLAMGGGWYFLVACEYLTFGSEIVKLDGIGYYLANAVYNLNNVQAAFVGLALFVVIVYSINRLIWKPLQYYAQRFNFQTVRLERNPEEEKALFLRIAETLGRIKEEISAALLGEEHKLKRALEKRVPKIARVEVPRIQVSFPGHSAVHNTLLFSVLFVIVMGVTAVFVSASLQKPIGSLRHSFALHPEAAQLPLAVILSVARILVAYVIALAWTLAAGILVMRSKKLQDVFIPLFDIGQSLPALALFPFVMLVVLHFVQGSLAMEMVAIILLLTGAQWYLLFNIIGAIRSIPGDIKEAADAFGLKGTAYVKSVVLPAIFPGVVLGSIQAWGGAWNALIVSEYVVYAQCPGGVCSVLGLGNFLDVATARWGDAGLVVVAIALMSLTVILINNFVWKRLFAMAEKYKFEAT